MATRQIVGLATAEPSMALAATERNTTKRRKFGLTQLSHPTRAGFGLGTNNIFLLHEGVFRIWTGEVGKAFRCHSEGHPALERGHAKGFPLPQCRRRTLALWWSLPSTLQAVTVMGREPGSPFTWRERRGGPLLSGRD
ncbi:hypothetical protein DFH94DRAFT_841625 [Russula ochroleuca]|uniref:Uncharacterized protein n=1 Tax=Russula ochroleuca TaxID=152965 RepID=A0A9P5TED8_9AGAM|nr:hypothetical protein DFH94DRAFT_841625 [Russula ochroleuca]